MDGIYKVAIPITSEGLLISISSPKACLESVMPSYYCIFAGYRKCHDGSTADVEKQQLIHQIGDYIIEVEEHSTFQLSLIEVRELVKVKMSMKKNMNMHFLQLGLKSISVVYKEYLDYQRIQKSEEEQALAQEFKRVYWRESKRKYRSQLSEQEREEIRGTARMNWHDRWLSKTEEEKEEVRATARLNSHCRWLSKTEEEKEDERAKANQYHCNRSSISSDELSPQVEVQHSTLAHLLSFNEGPPIPDLTCHIHVETSSQSCFEKLQNTALGLGEEGYCKDMPVHQSPVCIVCDIFIIGTQSIHWIRSEQLKFHSNILSSSYFYKEGINALLKDQYTVNHHLLCNLLLSPRSRRDIEADAFSCCELCFKCLSEQKRRKSPPKYAISNGFAIGSLPEDISRGVTPLVNNLVAPIRAFNYFLSFSKCKEHRITGNFTFFSQDASENVGALQYTGISNNNPSIYIILSGSYTPLQLDKIRKEGCYSWETFENIYLFLHSNNKHYLNLPSIENIPRPVVEEIRLKEGENNHSEGSDHHTVDDNNDPIYWKYWFPNIEDPDKVNGSFRSQSEFAKALWVGETPTLIYHPSKIVNQATLSQLCPIAFPFGTGDVNEKRKPLVSDIECYQHYLKISLPQFSEGQVVLIIHHMFQRKKSFLSGITKCNISCNGSTIADQLSEITASDLDDVITEMKHNHHASGNVHDGSNPLSSSSSISQFLKCIKTSCTPIGYTNEAASDARMKMFSLWMTFGPPSLLFTFSPCDECSFKMHLYATGNQVAFPNMKNFELMSSTLTLRKSLRVKYPGACARQFDDLLQIVISELLGWQNGQQKDNFGIFGKLQAYAAGVEEQGRTSLHAHIILWILHFYLLQMKLFSRDVETRKSALTSMKSYLKAVLSSKFIFDDEVEDNLTNLLHVNFTNVEEDCKSGMSSAALQHLREMRHIQYRKLHQGKILHCSGCKRSWSTTEIINTVIEHLFHKSLHEYPGFWQEGLTFPLKDEQIELIALRYQYDIQGIPENASSLRQMLQLIVMIFFNTHDWKHRKSCFKKGNECRFHLPQMPCEDINIRFNTDNIDDVISGRQPDTAARWYLHDGQYVNVCSYDVQTERKPWDLFVNTNNPYVSKIFGYNNNVSMGSISTLYYCTLYASKTNQEEETYPYLKACEAVRSRIKKMSETQIENGLSSRQIGLRRLLSGINAHLSSCVVSATMAWYLVTHGSRFHYSHQFKPLLLSQYEAWFEGASHSRRIRYKKTNKKKGDNAPVNSNIRSPTGNGDESSEVWFDSDVSNYIFRPEHPIFNNMSVWEYHAKYDLRVVRPKCYLGEDQDYEDTGKYFRFKRGHPGFQYSCLVKRDRECIPKLYYSSKFPDIASLQMYPLGHTAMDESCNQVREAYAKKAMLMFFPFRSKQELYGKHNRLWESFIEQKQMLLSGVLGEANSASLYTNSIQILQNIQDLLNVKRVPNVDDILLSCTDIHDADCISTSDHPGNDQDFLDENHSEAHIELMAHYVNELSQEGSTFNSSLCDQERSILLKLKSGVISIQPTIFPPIVIQSDAPSLIEDSNTPFFNELLQPRTIISVISRALDMSDIQSISLEVFSSSNASEDSFSIDLSSLDKYALQNNLDLKQSIAFDAICSSFMLSFLNDSKLNISSEEKEHYRNLLQGKGATDQLLMCVTGPGGSGKSHVIKCCRLYCKAFCDAIGKPFDFSIFPVTATSNSAASLLQGKTIHKAAMLRRSIIGIELSTEVDWTVTKVLIIDEISMAGLDLFPKLDKHLRILTGNRHLLYGGIHIIFTGDFMQLAPIGSAPIFSKFDDIHWHGSLNAAIFLDKGNHRFSKDPLWGDILGRVQLGVPTPDDLAKMNERLLSLIQLPEDIDFSKTRLVYGCFTNKRRNAITNANFLNFVMHNNPVTECDVEPADTTLLIKSYLSKDESNVGPDFHKLIWSICGDNNVDAKNNIKIDPCLKLIKGCPLMINSNVDREKNLVKGTLGNFVGVRWKPGCTHHVEDYHGFKVMAAHVSDLECIFLKLEHGGKIVELKPEVNSIDITIPVCPVNNQRRKLKGFKISQFAVNLSLATTGHKLQGMTKDILILSEISLVPNWLYVVLSRVTTLQGLFLMMPLTMDMFFPIPDSLQNELDFLRKLEEDFIRKISRETIN